MIILLVVLTLILIFCLNWEKNEYVAPSFVFCASFLFSCVWATIYAKQWELNLNLNTFLVISGGVLEFVLVAYATRWFLRKGSIGYRESSYRVNSSLPININRPLLYFVTIFELFSIFFTIYEIVVATGNSNISAALVNYNNITKFTEDIIVFPHAGLLYLVWAIVDAVGFWITYVLANSIITKKRSNIAIVVLALSMASSFLRGARTNGICKLMSFVCIYVILLRRNAKIKKNAVNTKLIVAIVAAVVIFLFSFKSFGNLLGRTITQTGTDYIALYCGSEISNLDTFLQGPRTQLDSYLDSQTFYVLLRSIKTMLGITEKTLPILPTSYINGIMLANVYTTFYQYIYDFGYIGEILLVALMSFLSQWAYENSKSFKEKNSVPIGIIIYAYIFPSLVLAFFSNKFYERQFSTSFIKYCVIWIILNYLLVKIRFKLKRK